MITRLIAAIVGLLAFAGCILGGMVSGNEFDSVILRSIKGLFLGCCVGWVAGKCCEIIVNETFKEVVYSDAAQEVANARLSEGEEPSSEDPQSPAEEIAPVASDPDASDDVEKVETEGKVDKDDVENDREQLNVPDMQETLAAKAAKELLGDVFKQ